MFHVRAPQRQRLSEAPLFCAAVPRLSSAAGAKWELTMLPWLYLSPSAPHQPSGDMHSRGAGREEGTGAKCLNHWQTSSRRANGQTNKLAAPLSHQPPGLSPPTHIPHRPPPPPDPAGHWVVALTVSSPKVPGGRQPFVPGHFIHAVWFSARHSSRLASYL